MGSIQRWKKILKDTDIPNLSEPQLFWRSIALLRLGNHKDALLTFEKIGSKQFSKTTYRLHASELYLKNQLIEQGEQLLTETYPKISTNEKELSQWLFIAKRYPGSDQLNKLIKRSKTSTASLSANFTDHLSWKRGAKLKNNQSNQDYYISWLDWGLKNKANSEELLETLTITLNQLPDRSYLCFQIFERLKKTELWESLIEKLFPHHHRSHNNLALMWKQWWSQCPNTHRKKLGQAMRETLNRRPNQELEELLTEFSNDP